MLSIILISVIKDSRIAVNIIKYLAYVINSKHAMHISQQFVIKTSRNYQQNQSSCSIVNPDYFVIQICSNCNWAMNESLVKCRRYASNSACNLSINFATWKKKICVSNRLMLKLSKPEW